ncbi:translational activator of cytochrome c oxidase 1 [Antennarius striatus]|uniref:translational activator of cytochrome c oxidase 1 n=1 Tax=Antennarius striatus TaxID=241820 RepID=UPI0035B3259E
MLWPKVLKTIRPRFLAVTSGRLLASTEPVHPSTSCGLYTPWKSPPVRPLRLCSALLAGHNKWSKVKNIKGPKDLERNKLFSRFAWMIKVAVKESGPNPDFNVHLARVLEQCKAKNMPKGSIDTAIKKASKPLSQALFIARGPGGYLVIIEVLTDNISLCHVEIKRLLNRNGAKLTEGAHHFFTQKGVVVVPAQNISMERALELAIEVGAEDVQETEDEEGQPQMQFICDTKGMGKVKTSLQDLGMQITSSELEYFANTLVSLDQDHRDAASALIEALSENADICRIWDNIQANS